ncbi:MAG: lipopolysaccharide biosynthesis protein [Burkholderiaceae bacterium]
MSQVVEVVVAPESPEGGMKAQVMSALRWSAIAKFGGQIISWAITLLVMRLLVPADYGLVAILTLIFMFLGMLGEMGFGSSIVQSPTLEKSEIRQTFGAALIVNGLICVALIAAAPLIAAFYHEPQLTDMTRVASLAFIGTGMTPVFSGLLQREMRFRTSARIEIVSGIVQNLAILAFALNGLGAWALIFGGLVGNPVRAVMLFASATTFYWPSFRFKGSRRLWRFGGNILVSRIVWYWSSQADVLIAGKFLGIEALGFYSVAVHLASLPMQRAAGMINSVAFAAFSKIQHDPRAVAHNTKLGVRLMAFVTFPVLWGIGAVSPELVEVAIGPAWAASILPLTLVALTIPFRMIGSIVSTTVMSMGRVDIVTWTTVIGAFVAPPLFYVGSRYGIRGLSVAWLVVTPILFMLNMFRALPILGLSMRGVFTEIWRPMTGAALMFVVVEGLRQLVPGLSDVPKFALLVTCGALTYAACTWLINRVATIEALTLLFPGKFGHLRVPASAP